MKKFQYIFFIISVFSTLNIKAQDAPSKLDFSGYISGMPQYYKIDTNEYWQGLLHTRFNFNFYLTDNITASAQFRNQILYGDLIEMGEFENGFITGSYFLPFTLQEEISDKGLLSMTTDRLWIQYSKNKLDIKIGRQRINWGQTFAWNPNDIFNTYNFFDFDYTEKPGADAVRIQYYTGLTSQFDIAAKVDSGNNVTAAALYKFNKWNCDFQFIGGYYSQPRMSFTDAETSESDWVGGFGFTGDYKGISLRSEITYLYPTSNSPNNKDFLLASFGLDYIFGNELSVGGEFFFSNDINMPGGANFLAMYSGPMTIKSLAYTKFNYFLQAAYPITPLIKASVSGMIFQDKNMQGYFIGPYLDFSLKDNIDLSVYSQFFGFKIEDPATLEELNSHIAMVFLRLKWSF